MGTLTGGDQRMRFCSYKCSVQGLYGAQVDYRTPVGGIKSQVFPTIAAVFFVVMKSLWVWAADRNFGIRCKAFTGKQFRYLKLTWIKF